MAKKQLFGIKFPFLADNDKHLYVAANETVADKVKSQLVHIVFTPKGQRIRNPEFGTDLIKYIFEQNDDLSWDGVKSEIMSSVSRWSSNIVLRDIKVVKSEEESSQIFVKLYYGVVQGNKTLNGSLVIEL